MQEPVYKPLASAQMADEEQTISLTDLFRNIRARWTWFVISIIAVIFLATIYLLRATPMYTRTTDILLKDDTTQNFNTDVSTIMGLNTVPASILNEMFVLSSPEVMEQVVSRLDLNEVYSYPLRLRRQELYHISPIIVEWSDSLLASHSFRMQVGLSADKQSVVISKLKFDKDKIDGEYRGAMGQPIETPIGNIVVHPTRFMDNPELMKLEAVPSTIYYSYAPVKSVARAYCERLRTEYVDDRGDVVTMTIACETAKKASDVLSEIVKTYNDRWIAERSRIALATSNFIDERLKSIEEELGDVETVISDYKSAHRMVDMDAMAQLYLSQSAENQRQLTNLSQQIAIAKFIRQVLESDDPTRLLPATAEIAGTNIQTLVTEYNKAVNDRNNKLLSVPEDSPLMIQKADAISKQREAILASVNAALESLNVQYKAITNLDSRTQGQLASAPGQAKYLMSEERKQKVKESLYVFLLQRREENELSQAFTASNIRMVTEPYGPTEPTSPRKMMVYLIALIIGLIIPTLLIYMREVTNTHVRSRKDIEDLSLPFMGEIPLADNKNALGRWLDRLKLNRNKKNTHSSDGIQIRPLMVRPGERSITAEAFRMIRTNMDFMRNMQKLDGEHRDGRVIMIVSLNAGSGKTFVSLNAAASYAVKGNRVCLVDFDLRKGTVSLNAGKPRHGLVDYLVGKETDLNKLIVKDIDGIKGFDILPEGHRPPNPTEMLYSERLAPMIEWLKQNYDYVFFDCPPVEIVADSLILNPYVDMTLFIIRAGLFDRSELSTLQTLYTSNRYNNLAIILNGTDRVHGVYGHYGYGYSYGYGYGSERKKDRDRN